MNGLMKIESLDIDPLYLAPEKKSELEKTISKLFSDTVTEVQKRSAMQSRDLLKGLPI